MDPEFAGHLADVCGEPQDSPWEMGRIENIYCRQRHLGLPCCELAISGQVVHCAAHDGVRREDVSYLQ